MTGPELFFSLYPVPRPRYPHRKLGRPPVRIFAGCGHVVLAPTKSEARARVKEQVGRLPAGFALAEVC